MNKNHLSEQNPYREELENLHQNIERARHAHRKWWRHTRWAPPRAIPLRKQKHPQRVDYSP